MPAIPGSVAPGMGAGVPGAGLAEGTIGTEGTLGTAGVFDAVLPPPLPPQPVTTQPTTANVAHANRFIFSNPYLKQGNRLAMEKPPPRDIRIIADAR